MCGIVGLFSKSPVIEEHLGDLLASMLIEMTERGPDSHNRLREFLVEQGPDFYTDNDSEVAAGYLTWQLRELK